MSKDVRFNIHLKVDGRDVVVQAKTSVKELGQAIGNAASQADKARNRMVAFASFGVAIKNSYDGIEKMAGAMSGYISKANAAAEAQVKLSTVMRQRMSASEDDIAAMNGLVAAQTKIGVVGGTVQRSGLQQLATFASQRATLEKLLPAMNNLVVQQRGLNATSEDAVSVANMMGKALMGNATAMTRVGITLTDSQKKIIQTGDEGQRAAAIAQAITDNVGNMNAEMAKTDAGRAKQAAIAYGGLEVAIGKVMSQYQVFINAFSQIGMMVTGMIQLGTAVVGVTKALWSLTGAQAINNVNTRMANAIVRQFTLAVGASAVSIHAAHVAIRALTWALRGLEVASVVGTVFAALSIALDFFVPKSDEASDSMKALGNNAEKTGDKLSEMKSQALAPVLTKYTELQEKWKQLRSAHEKNAFIKDNAAAFRDMGVGIRSVSDAEDFLVKNTSKVVSALTARAEAAAAYDLVKQDMEKAIKYEDMATEQNKKNREIYKKKVHTGYYYADEALDREIDSGRMAVTNPKQRQYEQWARVARQNAKRHLAIAQRAQGTADAGLKPYAPIEPSTAGRGTGRGTTRGSSKATVKVEKADPGLLNDLRRQLQEATKEMNGALTIEAVVEARGKRDDIQKQIDALEGNDAFTIEAEVKPAGPKPGSVEYKREAYKDAENAASQIQSDFDSGIIDTSEAQRQIDALNDKLQGIDKNLKPIHLQVDASDVDKKREKLQGATDSVEQLGQSLGQLGESIGVPELNVAGTMAQAIATMTAGYAAATLQSASLGPWAWIAFAATGLAQLAAMISSVKSMAGSYATGGIIGGYSYSGDKLTAHVNSGEMILNRQQQARLFALANGVGRVALPSVQHPRLSGLASGVLGTQRIEVSVSGRMRGRDLLLCGDNARGKDSKIGKRWG